MTLDPWIRGHYKIVKSPSLSRVQDPFGGSDSRTGHKVRVGNRTKEWVLVETNVQGRESETNKSTGGRDV